MSIDHHLSPNSLQLLLTSEFSSEEEKRASAHLDDCPICRTALEKTAADVKWWEETAMLLRVDPDDLPPAGDEDWSAIDFSVDFLEPTNSPALLGKLNEYEIHSVLGRGGMGVVLKARDPHLDRFVAIKVLGPQWAPSNVARTRFAREAKAAAAVVHPNVITIHQVRAHGRLPYLVMPLVAGQSLQQRLASRGPFELVEVLRIGMQAAEGLAAAHQQGLVHRDVKPANILLEPGIDRAVLTDFGLARAADDRTLTHWGIIAGTPAYMSPEQSRGEQVDGRSDLFSLGCVIYEMATGRPPFEAGSTLALLRRICEEAAPAPSSLRPELPRWFDRIVLKLLSKDAAQRFSTAKEASKVLAQCLAHEQDSATQLPIEFTDKPRHWRWAAIGVAIAMMGFAIFAMVQPTGPKLRLDIVPEERAEPFDPAWRTVDREIREIDQRLDALERGKPK